jgi:hypothetical protein
MYNQFVQGNAELLSISSSDSIWNSDEEEQDNPPPAGDNIKEVSGKGYCPVHLFVISPFS